jgi:hypothetical protein
MRYNITLQKVNDTVLTSTIINCDMKRFKKKRPCGISSYYPNIRLERVRTPRKHLSGNVIV